MDLDFKKIANAWWDSYFGPTELKELAKERAKICDICPKRKIGLRNLVPFPQCSVCGCPIGKKVFSNAYNDCPEQRWEEVDSASKYFEKRDKNSLI